MTLYPDRFAGRTAIITGGASGLGRAVAKRFVAEGGKVALWDVNADWLAEAKADEEIGGGKWDESISTSAKGLDNLGFPKGSPFRIFLSESGLGNHPEMIRAFARVGKAIGEDGDFVRADPAAQVTNPARILYPNNPPKGA